MKKSALLFSGLIIATLAFTSCKKCTTCTYTYQNATTLPEKCGTTDEIAAYKISVKSQYSTATVNCVDK